MVCCFPDFTHPDPAFRAREIAKQIRWIDMTHALGGSYCRVLSGQRRPELSIDEGVTLAAESIQACLPHAQNRGITLILENHSKDGFWEYPEFAQKMDVFCQFVDRIDHPNFGVNYDAIFKELKSKGFHGWISIEDGVNGIDELVRSVAFLKRKIAEHWPQPR